MSFCCCCCCLLFSLSSVQIARFLEGGRVEKSIDGRIGRHHAAESADQDADCQNDQFKPAYLSINCINLNITISCFQLMHINIYTSYLTSHKLGCDITESKKCTVG